MEQCVTAVLLLCAQGIKALAELPAEESSAQSLPSLRSGLSGLEAKLACAGALRLSRYAGGPAVAVPT